MAPRWFLAPGYADETAVLGAGFGFVFGIEVMLACSYSGETGALKTEIGFIFGTEVMLAFA